MRCRAVALPKNRNKNGTFVPPQSPHLCYDARIAKRLLNTDNTDKLWAAPSVLAARVQVDVSDIKLRQTFVTLSLAATQSTQPSAP